MFYSWCHASGSFSVISYNQNYLHVPTYTGSWGNRFQDAHGTCKHHKERAGVGHSYWHRDGTKGSQVKASRHWTISPFQSLEETSVILGARADLTAARKYQKAIRWSVAAVIGSLAAVRCSLAPRIPSFFYQCFHYCKTIL